MSLFWQETVSQFLPSIIMLPSFCFSKPAIMLKIVDLPHPDGPSSPKTLRSQQKRKHFLKPEHLFRMICLYQLILIFSFCLLLPLISIEMKSCKTIYLRRHE